MQSRRRTPTRLVAGNWKMNGSREKNRALLEALLAGYDSRGGVGCAVCAPYPYLAQIEAQLRESRIAWGAQDLSEHASGAFTGDVSASMLAEFGCRYVLVGHSERRQLHAESDERAAAKFQAAQSAGLIPILCVGETLAEREAGRIAEVVERQLAAVLAKGPAERFAKAVLAYEPVWAIGTGRNAAPEQAQEVHATLRARMAAASAQVAAELPILYGGSVKASNAAAIFAMPDIDGGLIGGASLDAQEFLAIVRAAELRMRE